METNNLQLTALETQVMESLINGLYAESGFSDVDAHDLAKWTDIPTRTIRGVISSLVKKGIVSIEGNDSGFQIIYLNQDHWYLHPRWKSEYEENANLYGNR